MYNRFIIELWRTETEEQIPEKILHEKTTYIMN